MNFGVGVPPLTGHGVQFDARADSTEPAPEFDLPLHDAEPEGTQEPVAPPVSSSSGRGIAVGMLVIGLLAGFVGGFLAGQRMAPPPPPRAAEVPRPAQDAPVAPPPAVIAEPAVIEPSENPTVGPAAEAKPAMLELASRPAGATVYVDEVRVGVTPVTINDVRLGTRRVRMELTGHRPWTTSVEVDAGAHLRIGASLE